MTRRSQVEPALWLWAPDDGRDRPWRKFQHLYWPLPFSLTFALWRIDSVRTAIAKKLKLEVRLPLAGGLTPSRVAQLSPKEEEEEGGFDSRGC